METPLIFVHIGKAGGGEIRRMLAAAARNFTRGPKKWMRSDLDEHFYPIMRNQSQGGHYYGSHLHTESGSGSGSKSGYNPHQDDHEYSIGKFCSSAHKNPRHKEERTAQGTVYCNATTPLGMMIACPESLSRPAPCLGCDRDSDQCNSVYVGHNLLGEEVHWLPPAMLLRWWRNNWATLFHRSGTEAADSDTDVDVDVNSMSSIDNIEHDLLSLLPGNHSLSGRHSISCHEMKREADWRFCMMKTFSSRIDSQFNDFWEHSHSHLDQHPSFELDKQRNFSPFYASLPVHRVTVIREPYSWLLSKFFWHSEQNRNKTCDDDLANATKFTDDERGWLYDYVSKYIYYLCGADCYPRFEGGMMTIQELEAQAESNLKQAFTVVGILNETEQFYEMLDGRFGFLHNMTGLNTDRAIAAGGRHSSKSKKKQAEIDRCTEIFSTETFRNELRELMPIMSVLERLFEVGVKVSRFQQEEIRQCNI